MKINKNLPSIEDVKDLKGKRVIVRGILNVPLEKGVVMNRYRLDKTLQTVKFLQKHEAKVILMGYIGRDPANTLKPVYDALAESIDNITWADGLTGVGVTDKLEKMKDGEVLLLENTRSDPREEANDEELGRFFASYGDIYVNSAFADSHREYASTAGIPSHLPSYFGIHFIEEYENLSSAFEPEHPSLFILGGAKFDTKMPLIEKFIDLYDHIFVGGALANDLFKAKGYNIGASMTSNIDLKGEGYHTNKKIILPIDVTVYCPEGKKIKKPEEVVEHDTILDAGPATIEMLENEYIKNAKTILWNGPLGDYERGFNEQTVELAKIVAKCKAHSIIGGGDTVASIDALGLNDDFGFVSTAGGAMLEFLEHGTLPALDAVLRHRGS